MSTLSRRDTSADTRPAPFAPPLDDAALDDLRWYLEVFSTWPTGPDYERAEAIEAQAGGLGPRAAEQRHRRRGRHGRGSSSWTHASRGQAADDGRHRPARAAPAVGAAGRRGRAHLRAGHRRAAQIAADDARSSSSKNLRAARARAGGRLAARRRRLHRLARGLARRCSTRWTSWAQRAEVEFLYPPTLKALTARLRDKQAPPVHVVHFDGHGVYDSVLGLGYLLFENDKHTSDQVDANRLGTLLNQCGVPLMVLNACQSAAQEEANPYASVAARLIRAGVGSVLAMNYSVLVVAAHKFVEAFYGGLADGLTVGQAVDQGRFELLSDLQRHTLTRHNAKGELVEETIGLRDWFLPALYQQAADPAVFDIAAPLPAQARTERSIPRALTEPAGSRRAAGRAAARLPRPRPRAAAAGARPGDAPGRGAARLRRHGQDHAGSRRGPLVPPHRALPRRRGLRLVRARRLAATSSARGSGRRSAATPNFTLGDGDPVARIGALLRERPALVILDNFESVLGREPLMPAEELKAVLDAVWSWAAGDSETRRRGDKEKRSRVLITTRDTTFSDARFRPSKDCAQIELGGLARDDALELAAAVLDDHGIDRAAIRRQDLVDLMERLGGHPLSLNLALPHLRTHTPAELSARFEELLPGFTDGAAKERNESLAVSLEFSLRRLGEETRAALPDLAVFQGGAMEYDLLAITQMDPVLWQAARAELEQAALVTVEAIPRRRLSVPALPPHPRALSRGPAAGRAAGRAGRALLEGILSYSQTRSYQSDTQHPHEARAIALRELPNLQRALDLVIAAGAAEAAVDFAARIAKFLNNFGRWRERDALMAKIDRLQVAGAARVTKAEYLILSQRGEGFLQQGRAAAGEQMFRDLLARLEAGAAYDAAYDHALTLFWLGRCLEAQGRPMQAIEWQRALEEFERLRDSAKRQSK